MAITSDRTLIFDADPSDTQEKFPCAPDQHFYKGQTVGIFTDGLAMPLSGSSMIGCGVSTDNFISQAGDNIVVQNKGYWYKNGSGGGLITNADIGKVAYTADDITVALSGGSPIGRIIAVDPKFGVKVRVQAKEARDAT